MNRSSSILSFTHGLNADFSTSIDWGCFHQHNNEIEMAFHPRGPVSYRFGGRLEEVAACETIMYWGAIPHQATELPENDVCYFLTVPITVFAQMTLPPDFIRRILSGEIMREADPILREVDLLMFNSWKKTDFRIVDHLRKSFIHWVQFRFIQFSYNTEALRPKQNPRLIRKYSEADVGKKVYVKVKRDEAIERMYEYVTNNYLRNICVDDVASSAGLNSNYANTLFREQTGTSIGRFINMLRIYKAQSLLLTTDLKVVDISLESGFRSLGNFYKMFEAHVGESPSRYRTQHMPNIHA